MDRETIGREGQTPPLCRSQSLNPRLDSAYVLPKVEEGPPITRGWGYA